MASGMINLRMALIYEIMKRLVCRKRGRTGLWRQIHPAFLPLRCPPFAWILEICGSSLFTIPPFHYFIVGLFYFDCFPCGESYVFAVFIGMVFF